MVLSDDSMFSLDTITDKKHSGKEKRAFDLIHREKKNVLESASVLASEGQAMTVPQLLNFKEHSLSILKAHEEKEFLGERLLESYERLRVEWDWMVNKTKGLVEKAEIENKDDSDYRVLQALKEFHSQMRTTLQKMGKLQGELPKTQNTINAQNVLVLMKGVRDSWFRDTNAEIVDGKIILNSPTPELLDAFNNYKSAPNQEATEFDQNV